MMRAHWIVFLVGVLSAAANVDAQQTPYPNKPIRLIVPFPAGGPSDVVARVFAEKLSDSFKQAVIVDNRPGAGGSIGTEAAIKAEPDGYTMVLVSAAYAANVALYKPSYDAVADVTPVALIGESGNVVAVHPSVPVNSVDELIAYDKKNPGKLNYGSGGSGGDTHLAAELFNQMAGTHLTHIPYKGTAPAVTDLLAGQIHLIFGNATVIVPHVKSNRLRAIAVTTARRSQALPEIPTVAERLQGYEAVTWAAILAPKRLPKDIAARWNSEVERILQLSEVREKMLAIGIEPAGGPPERLRDILERDIAKWRKVVETAGIKVGG